MKSKTKKRHPSITIIEKGKQIGKDDIEIQLELVESLAEFVYDSARESMMNAASRGVKVCASCFMMNMATALTRAGCREMSSIGQIEAEGNMTCH